MSKRRRRQEGRENVGEGADDGGEKWSGGGCWCGEGRDGVEEAVEDAKKRTHHTNLSSISSIDGD